jgi:hypothetical protein
MMHARRRTAMPSAKLPYDRCGTVVSPAALAQAAILDREGSRSLPEWFHWIAIASLAAGGAAALLIAIDEIRHPQPMPIMNAVWPICALFGTIFVLAGYVALRRARARDAAANIPWAGSVAIGTLHCGAGCTLGDIIAEWLAYAVPAVAIAFGWKTLFADKMFAVWILDYIFAFVFGIAFQYYAIVPMRKLSPREGIVAALKADSLSLTAWQIGMYGVMALAQLYLVPRAFGRAFEVASAEFWFVMQIAMLAGFFTSYPVNWWLIRAGIKQEM